MLALLVVACSGINAPLTYPVTEADNGHAGPIRYASPPAAREWGLFEVARGAKAAKLSLPARESELAPTARSSALFKSLSPGARAALLYQGFVSRNAAHQRTADAYVAAAAAHQPVVVTLDTLARQTARTLQALSEDFDRMVGVPATRDFVELSTDALERWVLPVELESARRELLTVMATARKLADPAYVVPRVVADSVAAELLRVGANSDDPQAARNYLGGYTFPLQGDVGAQRRHLRAAWLLSTLLHEARDSTVHQAWQRGWESSHAWLGESQERTPVDIGESAARAGLVAGDFAAASDTTRLDAWRTQLTQDNKQRPRFSMFGRFSPVDDRALGRALDPRVPDRKRPSALDVAYVFGSSAALLDVELLSSVDAKRYAAALDPLRLQLESSASAGQGGIYHSWLLALRALSLRSHAAVAEPYAASLTHDARLTQSALAAWSVGRQLLELGDAGASAAPRPPSAEAELDAVAELHPEAIANLGATLEQAHRATRRMLGVTALRSDAMVSATSTLLKDCLRSANARALGSALDDQSAHELSHVASTLLNIDAMGEALGVSATVQSRSTLDLGAHIADLEVGSSAAREGIFLVPDPVSGKWMVRTGLLIPHEEGPGKGVEAPMVGTYFVGEK